MSAAMTITDVATSSAHAPIGAVGPAVGGVVGGTGMAD